MATDQHSRNAVGLTLSMRKMSDAADAVGLPLVKCSLLQTCINEQYRLTHLHGCIHVHSLRHWYSFLGPGQGPIGNVY